MPKRMNQGRHGKVDREAKHTVTGCFSAIAFARMQLQWTGTSASKDGRGCYRIPDRTRRNSERIDQFVGIAFHM